MPYQYQICGRLSHKLNGFISKKNDYALPQPIGFGCECDGASFTFVQEQGFSIGEGENTNANRACEAGEVKELKNIRRLLEAGSQEVHWGMVHRAMNALDKLIQKREGLGRE